MRSLTSHSYRLKKIEQLGKVGATSVDGTVMGVARRMGGYFTIETVLVWVAFAVTVACNAAFESLRLNGTTVGEVSSQVFAWFSPAPYAFFIWGVIYIALAAWLVRFTIDAPNRTNRVGREAVLFTASCVLNVAWLALFHFGHIALGLLTIIALWAVVFTLYYGQRREATSQLAWVPFSIYASWLTVASVVNAVNLVTRLTDGGFFLINEASVVVLTGAVLAVAYAVRRAMEDPVYPLIVLWAVVAVGVHVLPVSPALAVIVFVMAALMGAALYVPLVRSGSPVVG